MPKWYAQLQTNSLTNCSVGLILIALQDQKIDLFESLKGQEEGYRRLGPMYRRFGNLKQKFEADLRSLHSNEEEDKENITNRSQPEATRTHQRCTVLAQIGANTARTYLYRSVHTKGQGSAVRLGRRAARRCVGGGGRDERGARSRARGDDPSAPP